MFNKYILGGCAAVIAITGATAYFFYKQNLKLRDENQLNKIQIENYTSEISDLETSFDKAKNDIDRLTRLNNDITASSNKSKEKLDKVLRTHDLEKIAARKATLMERIINRASDKTMSVFETLSDPSIIYTNTINFGTSSLERK